MKKLLFSSLILFLLNASCTNTSKPVATENATLSDTTKIDTSDFEATTPTSQIAEGEEDVDGDEEGLNYKDSTVSDYGDYHFTLIPYIGEGGGELRILNKKTGQLLVAQDKEVASILSFEGAYLVTSGATTTTMNNFSVIKISDGSQVFGSECTEFDLDKGVITFKAPIEESKIAKLPTCNKEVLAHPQNIGYVEIQKYDIKAQKYIKTGVFECCFAE